MKEFLKQSIDGFFRNFVSMLLAIFFGIFVTMVFFYPFLSKIPGDAGPISMFITLLLMVGVGQLVESKLWPKQFGYEGSKNNFIPIFGTIFLVFIYSLVVEFGFNGDITAKNLLKIPALFLILLGPAFFAKKLWKK